jgi:signal transduction histidine kinase
MIPQRILISLYIILTFFFFFSCQDKDTRIVKQTNNKVEVEKLIVVANQFYNTKNFDSAFVFYNKIKHICNPITDSENYVSTINRMAEIQQSHGDYIGSQNTITEAIPYLNYVKNPKHRWNLYTTTGLNYIDTYDYNHALIYFNKALLLNVTETRNQLAKNHIAQVYLLQKKYYEAIQIFHLLVSNSSVKKNPKDYAKTLDNIGYCYDKIDDSNALHYLEKALKIRIEINDQAGIGTSYFHLAQFYSEDNPTLAKKFMLLSYEKFTSIKKPDNRLSSLEYLIKNSSDKDLKKYSIIYADLVDSLSVMKQKAKNQFARIKYDSKRDKDENLKLKTYKAENQLQLEKQKNRNIISYIIIALSLCLILVLYFYLTSRGNREKIEASYKSETRISKKLHDELANDIYHTMAFAENRNLALAENKNQLMVNLDAIYSRTRDISKENNPIITNENYVHYLKEMISGFNTPNISLILKGVDSIFWCEISKNKKLTVYRVIQELLVNMKKHSNATLVGITFEIIGKEIHINYTDNGKGMNISTVTFKNGLHNVENRILNLKGNIHIESAPDKGFKIFLKLPV